MREYGIENEEDLAEFQEYRRQKAAAKKASEQGRGDSHADSNHFGSGDSTDDFDRAFDDCDDSDTSGDASFSNSIEKRARRKATVDIIKDIARRTKDNPSEPVSATVEDDEDIDEDEFMPSAVDYSIKIERAKERSAAEIDRITYFEELHNKAAQLTQEGKYTVAWFNTLLEMESVNSGEANANSKEVSISFARVERDPGTKRTLVLKYPNRYILKMSNLVDTFLTRLHVMPHSLLRHSIFVF